MGRLPAPPLPTRSSAKWQAAKWPGLTSRSSGSFSAADGLRHEAPRDGSGSPMGGLAGLGTSPFKHDALLLPLRVRHRNGRQQRHRVRMQWLLVQVAARREFGDLAEVHDRHAVADVLHDRQVVRDEQVGQIHPPSAGRLQQVDDLRLDRHVERAHGLVRRRSAWAPRRGRGRRRCAAAGRRRTRAGSGGRAYGDSPTMVQQFGDSIARLLPRGDLVQRERLR